jgi:hypothetical protein
LCKDLGSRLFSTAIDSRCGARLCSTGHSGPCSTVRDTVVDLFQVGPLQLNTCKMLTWQRRQAVQHCPTINQLRSTGIWCGDLWVWSRPVPSARTLLALAHRWAKGPTTKRALPRERWYTSRALVSQVTCKSFIRLHTHLSARL